MSKSDKALYAFVYLPSGEPFPENEVVCAIASSKKERDRYIRERGCKNMRIVKIHDPMEFGEYLGYPSEVPFLNEYKVGLNKDGSDLTMLMTADERDEVMHALSGMTYAMRNNPCFAGVLFKKKYREALNIIRQCQPSAINMMVSLFGDTFTN